MTRQVLGCASAGTVGLPSTGLSWFWKEPFPVTVASLTLFINCPPTPLMRSIWFHLPPRSVTVADRRNLLKENVLWDLVYSYSTATTGSSDQDGGAGDKHQVVLFTLLLLLSQEAQCGLKLLPWSPCLKMTSAS